MQPEEINRRVNLTAKLANQGRVVIEWWDTEPIHRPMTILEKATRAGLDKDAVALGLVLLSSKDYKPSYII